MHIVAFHRTVCLPASYTCFYDFWHYRLYIVFFTISVRVILLLFLVCLLTCANYRAELAE